MVVWVVGDKTHNGSESGSSFRQALYFKEVGFNLHDTMIYEKDSINFPDTNRYYQIFEYMFVFSKGKPKTTNLINDRENKWADGKNSSSTIDEFLLTNFGTGIYQKVFLDVLNDSMILKFNKYSNSN